MWENESNYYSTMMNQNQEDNVLNGEENEAGTSTGRRVLKGKRRSANKKGKGLKWQRKEKRRFRRQAKRLSVKHDRKEQQTEKPQAKKQYFPNAKDTRMLAGETTTDSTTTSGPDYTGFVLDGFCDDYGA